MSLFIRVRSARVGDPDRDFDVPLVELERFPHLYRVVDPVPSPVFRPPTIRPGVIRRAPVPAKKRARKVLVKNTPPPMGHDS